MKTVLTLLTAATLAAALPVAASSAQTVQTAHRDVLLQTNSSWNSVPYKAYPAGQPQLTMLKITLRPHSALPWHTHPMPNAGYVLEGALTIHDRETGRTRTFHQGEAFAESVDDIHRGETGDQKTVLLLTYAGTPGMPTSVPVRGEKPEY